MHDYQASSAYCLTLIRAQVPSTACVFGSGAEAIATMFGSTCCQPRHLLGKHPLHIDVDAEVNGAVARGAAQKCIALT
jgi:hypothetical protein